MAAARPRTAGLGALGRQSMRVYNEPFDPIVAEKDENEAHVLRLQLPDFDKQHVKVKVEGEKWEVVVTGDRRENYRLSILEKTFRIPPNCVINKIHHELEAGILTITMPKQITAPVQSPPVEAPPETAAPPPPPKEPEQTTPEKGISEKISPENEAPPPKETEQTTPEKGISEKISPENEAPPPKETEPTTPEKGISEKISPENEAPTPKETEPTTPEKGSEEIPPEKATPPATKTEITEGPEEEGMGKSAGLQKQASAKAVEKAPTPTPAAADKGPVERDSGEVKTTADVKIGSPDRKQTETKETENQNPEKGKDSKTEEVRKNEETAKIAAGTPPPKATRIGKLAGGGLKARRMPLQVTVSLAAAVVIVAAAYFAFAYYGLSMAME